MSKKKILWIAHEANKSGANLCLTEFMQIALNDGFDILLILPHAGSMESAARELNVPFRIIHYYPWVVSNRPGNSNLWISVKKLLRNTVAIIQIAIVIIRNRIDLVFSNTSVISAGAWASLITAKKHYWYVHEMGEEDFGFQLPWGKLSYRFMNFTSEKVLTNSNHLAEKYRKKWRGFRIEVVRYAVLIPNYFTPVQWADDKPVKLLLLGQVAETKGHLTAVESLSALLRNGYNISLSIVGKCESSEFMERLMRKTDELKLNGKIHFTNYTNNPAKVIAEHHALLMCSKCEAFGRVTIEAMKIGIPVIGSDTCGTKEIITDRKTGYLFKQGNASSLALSVRSMIDDDALREKIVSDAKIHAEQLNNKDHFLKLLNKQ